VVSEIVGDFEELATGLHAQLKHEIMSALPIYDPVRSTLDALKKN